MQKFATLIVASLGLIAAAGAQSVPSIGIGVSGGVYLPSNSEIRSLFGSTEYHVGVSPFGTSGLSTGFAPEFSVIDGDSNGNKFFLLPIALAYEKDFASTIVPGSNVAPSVVPYLRVSGGTAYYDYSITRADGNHYGLKRFGGTAGLEAGLKFVSRAKAYVKYDLFSVEQHFNFSGLEIGAVISIGKI